MSLAQIDGVLRAQGYVAIALAFAGCLAPTIVPAGEAADDGSRAVARSVVAIVDTGVNPYHEAFRRPALPLPAEFLDAETARPPVAVPLSFGPDFQASYESDREFWESVEPGRLYHFTGTNILAVSFMDAEGTAIRDQGLTTHGTPVASVIANSNRDAWVVVVEAWSAATQDSSTIGLEARGLRWAVSQPWIDVISLSIAFPAGYPGLEEFPSLVAEAVRSGKTVVAGAGNYPEPSFHGQIAGIPSVLSVGGVVRADGAEAVQASKTPDFVSDWEGYGAESEDAAGWREFQGTSLAAPVAAAEVSKVYQALRLAEADGTLNRAFPTPAEIRDAFNRTAVYWNTTDYRGTNLTEGPLRLVFTASAPILPAPWIQMGWGYLGPGAAERALAVLLGESTAEKPADAAAYMDAVQRARGAWWATIGPGPIHG